MEEYLYRYIPFETFVGMVQSQSLTFVLPELWDDPQENASFFQYIPRLNNSYQQLALWTVQRKVFCQCWTILAESDAMWRIYSYNNRSIRVKIKQSNIEFLDDVSAVKVKYLDTWEFDLNKHEDIFLKSLSQKRIAFKHEQEIRLIKHYRFSGDEDLKQHIDAALSIMGHPQILESGYSKQSMDEKAKMVAKILNYGPDAKEYMDISFAHIPGFIEGVLVHPLAPEWYVNIVHEFCDRNAIPFEGKSTLYSE